MKKITLIPVSLLLCAVAMSSCSSNKLAVATTDDNMYFMSGDVKKATQNAVANNQPATFQELAGASAVPQDNFSSKNVNPEYLSRYGQVNGAADQEVVYFDDNQQSATVASPNIDIYNNYTSYNSNAAWRNPSYTMGFNPYGMGFSPYGMGMFNPFGMGMGYNPYAMGMGYSPYGFGMGFYDPFFNPGWGWRSGFNLGLNFGFGNRMYNSFGGGYYNPFWGGNQFGSLYGMGRPIIVNGPVIILPGSENGNRNIVYGARPSRGSSNTNGASALMQNGGTPSTARAQARENVANSSGASPRRLDANESSRAASRDFSTSQNDYYSSGSSRVESNSRNVNSAASGRSSVTPSRNSTQSARPSEAPSSTGRGYNYNPNSGYNDTGASRSTNNSPSYNRATGAGNGATRSSFGRSESSSYSSGSAPSRSSSNAPSFNNAPSRSSSGGFSSAPSRSTGGSSGSSSSGGSRGRGN